MHLTGLQDTFFSRWKRYSDSSHIDAIVLQQHHINFMLLSLCDFQQLSRFCGQHLTVQAQVWMETGKVQEPRKGNEEPSSKTVSFNPHIMNVPINVRDLRIYKKYVDIFARN